MTLHAGGQAVLFAQRDVCIVTALVCSCQNQLGLKVASSSHSLRFPPSYVLSAGSFPLAGKRLREPNFTCRPGEAARAAGSLLLFATPCDRYVAGR